MRSFAQFFLIRNNDTRRGFRMGPAIIMMLIFLSFFCATIYVLISSR
jgi:hypothetical protein